MIALREPPKEEVLAFQPGSEMRREAFGVLYNRATGQTFEAIVDLKTNQALSLQEIRDVQPSIMGEDARLVNEIVRADPRWQQAMRNRGIEDFRNVQVGIWPAGFYGDPDGEAEFRAVRVTFYERERSANRWARPIEGVAAYVNLTAREVVELVDSDTVTVPQDSGEYVGERMGALQRARRFLERWLPRRTNFEVRGNEVRWENWRFRFALHPREGLVLYTAGIEDDGRFRSVLYRAALSELVTLYGDPSPAWFFRNSLEEGELGLGPLTNSQEPFADAPPDAVFFDAMFATHGGVPTERPRTVALYEREGGILWKHYDDGTGRNDVQRARQLVLSWIITVGNYDYMFNWVFHRDGVLELEVLLTGIMLTRATAQVSGAAEHEPQYAQRVSPDLAAVHHQHFFNFRLDMDIDGMNNSVLEMNVEAEPDLDRNPHQNAFLLKEVLFRNEMDAKRIASMGSGAGWKVINPSRVNVLGGPVGYMLMPGEGAMPFATSTSWVRKRAGFLDAHLWVTPFDPAERYAAGNYPNQSRGNDGLPAWTAANRPLENRDVVLWYTIGTTHIPRPEEWPVMPAHRAGFKLSPNGFFPLNPALRAP